MTEGPEDPTLPPYGEPSPPPYGGPPPPPQPADQQSGYAAQGYPQPGYPAGPYGANPQAPYGVDPKTGLPYSDKSKIIAGLLQIFLGGFGIGRFYLGDTKTGIWQIVVTVLTCGIGSLWGL